MNAFVKSSFAEFVANDRTILTQVLYGQILEYHRHGWTTWGDQPLYWTEVNGDRWVGWINDQSCLASYTELPSASGQVVVVARRRSTYVNHLPTFRSSTIMPAFLGTVLEYAGEDHESEDGHFFKVWLTASQSGWVFKDEMLL